MKTLLLSIFVAASLLAVGVTRAADQYEAVITVTNAPATGETLTINTDVRTWTTNASPTSSQIAVSTNGVCAAATNLFRSIASNMPTGTFYIAYSSTNAVKLFAQAGTLLDVSSSNNWASIVFTTNTVSTAYTVRMPLTAEPSAATRTNIATYLIQALKAYGIGWTNRPFITGITTTTDTNGFVTGVTATTNNFEMLVK